MIKRYLLIFIYSIGFFWVNAQESDKSDRLLKRIASYQAKRGEYLTGGFKDYVARPSEPLVWKTDHNIFYNALIVYILNDVYNKLSPDQQHMVDSIKALNALYYWHFKSTAGINTYKFWRTDTTFIIPYTDWLTLIPDEQWVKLVSKQFELPEDMDCTSLALMTSDISQQDAESIHQLMQNYTNNDKYRKNKRKLAYGSKKYKKYGAYSVWFGKDIPVAFDVCVLCNILTFVQHYHLTWTASDSASLKLIVASIKNGDYSKRPLSISPNYGSTSIILYHLARLMKTGNIPELEALKPELEDQANNLFAHSNDILEEIMLSTALMKWGKPAPALLLPAPDLLQKQIEENTMPFFIANIPQYFPLVIQKPLLALNTGVFYHYCPAFNDALLLEYLMLKK